MIYWICFCLAKIFDRFYFSTTFAGKEHLPAKGGFIIAANHISNIDPFILGICDWRRFSYVAKESLFENKFLGFLFRQVGSIPIKRDGADFRAIREIIRRLKGGCPVVLFPEGTRGSGNREKKTQPGVALIALKSNVVVVPAYIEGSDKALPAKAKWFTRYPVKIKFGPPLKFDPSQSYAEISSQIMSKIYLLTPAQ